jgi:internalin A
MTPEAQKLIAQARAKKSKELDLSNCKLTQIPELFGLEQLEVLYLTSNKLTRIANLDKLPNLQELNLSKNKLTQIENLDKLPNLQTLFLGANQLTQIANLDKLPNLQRLGLSHNQLTQIENLDKLPNLQTLYLGGNQLTQIANLDKLPNLQELYLYNNQLTQIANLDKLPNLQTLYLGGNKLTRIANLDELPNLQRLDLGGNQLTQIANLDNLPNLHLLDLNHNQLTQIANLDKLPNLQELNLSYNQLTQVENLDKLPNLQKLDLSYNQLTRIANLDKLPNLQTLSLDGNQLTQIANLDNLPNLQELDLSNNKLTQIANLDKLPNLQRLDLSRNQIRDLSPLLPFLQQKKNPLHGMGIGKINVAYNPITAPPMEIIKQGKKAVLRWLEEYAAKDNLPLQQAKLLILGAGGVGKTSLMHKLRDPNSDLPPPEATTVGITVVTESVVYTIDGSEYTLNIWDFGGQDVYHPTHQFFLTKNSVYVLMEDGREKKTDFHYWLQVQELLAGNSPLFILQNVRNKSRSAIPMNELKAKFGNIREYFELDLSEVTEHHQGFKAMVSELQTKLKNLPHIGELWPRKRYEIRQALLDRKNEQYISLKQYRQLCNEHGYNELERQNDLLQQLHFLGVVLHFADEPFLQDIVITDPQWATNAVYAILDHTEKHYEKKGHFTHSDLCQVWHQDCYEGKFAQLLALMGKFELSFPLADAPHTYITPLLLPDDKPNYTWDEANNLQLRYTYDFMPKGILARLIVRQHALIKDHLFWKRGVVLHDQDTEAQITEDYEGRNLFLRVKGSEAKGLMYEISREIDRINSTYHFSERIRTTKRVPCNCSTCKNAAEPHFYDYDKLKERQKMGKKTIECENAPYEDATVQALLEDSGVEKSPKLRANTIKTFISYAQEDHEHLRTLKKHISPLIRQGMTVWYDQEILAGADWNREIEQHLRAADVVLLLISADFLDDRKKYIWDTEMPIIMQKHKQGQLIIPIVVRDCNWEWEKQLAKIQAVNGGKALNSATDKDTAFANAARQIKDAINHHPPRK